MSKRIKALCKTCGAEYSTVKHVCDPEDVELMNRVRRSREMQDDGCGVRYSPSYAERLSVGFAMLSDDHAHEARM